MICRLKTLGLALTTTLVLNAVITSSALAQAEGKFTSASGQNFTLTGIETVGLNNTFTGPFGMEFRCPGSTYTGHMFSSTPHQFIPTGATDVTLTPKSVNCPGQVDMNGCDYALRSAATISSSTYSIKTNIECPGKNKIVVTKACEIEIGTQTDLVGLHVKNETGHLGLRGSVNLKAIICGFSTTATQHLDLTVKAHNELGQAINVSISD